MKKVVLILPIILGLFTNCGGDDDKSPAAITLIFPEKDKECTEGVAENAFESTITFRWDTAENNDLYEVNVRDLNSNFTRKTESQINEVDITLERGVAYEWFVVSKSNETNETKTSEKWKFYNEGLGTENYAPFPADSNLPANNTVLSSAGLVSLSWNGADIDNDILEYEVFFGTSTNPTTSIGTTQQTTIDTNIASGTSYYWNVKTNDQQGNSSISKVFNFSVQ